MNVDEEESDSRNLLCCFCFRSKNVSTSSFYVSDVNQEPFEYVVEKLAIKRVPLSLFATSEDLKRLRKPTSNKLSLNTKSPVREKSATPSPEREIPKPIYEVPNNKEKIKINDSSSHTVLNYHKEEIIKETVKMLPSKILSASEEEELVSQVLNRHSSVYETDLKRTIPKDPEHLPAPSRVKIPSQVRAALKNKNKTEVKVDVHTALIQLSPQEEETLPHTKEISPSLRKTIQSLKFAQKPHLAGNQPKNQKSLKDNCDNIKDNNYNVANGGLLPLQSNSKYVYPTHEVKETNIFHNKSPKQINEELNVHVDKNSIAFPFYSPTIVPEEQTNIDNMKKDHSSFEPKPFSSDPVKLYRILESSNEIDRRKIRTYNVNTNLPDIPTSNKLLNTSIPRLMDQFTENSRSKVHQNLKCKIIIKHRQDKERGDREDFKEEDCETDD